MLGNSTTKTYIKNQHSVDIKPKVFLEFNGNDIANPYFYGTGNNPSASYDNLRLTLNAIGDGGIATVQNNEDIENRGYSTAISPTKSSYILNLVDIDYIKQTRSYYANGPVSSKSVKFTMFLKSDYYYQVLNPISDYREPEESFNVVITAYGLDSSNKVVRSEVVTKIVTVDASSWIPVEVLFANPDDEENKINRVQIKISFQAPAALLVSQLICSPISEYEVYVSNRLPVREVFESMRPGDFMVDMLTSRPTITVDGATLNQQCTPMHMVMSYALGPKYENVQRSVVPFQENPYSYYVSGSDEASKKIWSLYEKTFKTNKLVFKINSIVCKPTSITIKILTSSGWVTIDTSTTNFDVNGILTLYYTGTTWSTTKWVNGSYPEINPSTGEIKIGSNPGSVLIHGIYFASSAAMTIINNDFNEISQYARLEMIEISPRLELDVSNYVLSMNIISEMDSQNNILPIGNISSNSVSIELSNIPITKTSPDIYTPTDTDPDIVPFSNFSSTSPIKDMMKKGVKVRGVWQINASPIEYVPAFTMYIDSWKDEDSSVSISAFDVIKNIQSLKARPVYIRNASVPEVIRGLLDPVGFADYDFQDLIDIKYLSKKSESQIGFSPEEIVPHFWTSKDNSITESLQELFKVYQVAMYADEYGCVRFQSLQQFNKIYKELTKETSPRQVDIYVQDNNDINSLSNIISSSFLENEKPQSISIKYRIPREHLGDPKVDTTPGQNQPIKSIIRKSTDIVWTFQEDSFALPYFGITEEGIVGIAQNYIPYSPIQQTTILRNIPYSCDLLIDDEIVSYNGKQFLFTYKTPGSGNSINRKNITIKSMQDIEMSVRDLMANYSASSIQYAETGKLMNVMRGLYGTVPSTHTRQSTSTNTRWKVREFTVSENGYKNMDIISPNNPRWSTTEYGMQLNNQSNNKILYLTPSDDDDDNNLMRNKRRLSASIKFGDIPKNKEGYIGIGFGVKVDAGNDIESGLIVWVGVQANEEVTKPVVFIEQIVSGTRKILVAKNDFDYSERLFEENENLEIILALNDKRSECRVLIGGTSAFAEKVEVKDKDGDKGAKSKKEYRDMPIKLAQPLGRSTSFGMFASHAGSAILGQFLFGISRDPQDMNDLNISNLENSYEGSRDKRPDKTFYIGNGSMLNRIVNKELVPGFNDFSSDNFTYTANPVARGLRVFEVDYTTFPVISQPRVEFLGYTYDLNQYQAAPLFDNQLPGGGNKK